MSFPDPDFAAIARMNRLEEERLRPLIEPLCREHGYGRIMQLVSEWWRERDPVCAISLGPCYGTLEAEAKRKTKRKKGRL